MTHPRNRDRWLNLAARHRAWSVEQARPELRDACDHEERARRAADEADRSLDMARRERAASLRQAFTIDTLRLRVVHEERLSGHVAQRAHEARDAVQAADALRDKVSRTMQERDAFERRLDARSQARSADASRVLAREVDELWSVARASALRAAEGKSDEETR